MQETLADHSWRHPAKRGGLPRRGGAVRPPGVDADMAKGTILPPQQNQNVMLSCPHSPSPHSAPPGLASNVNLTIEHSFIVGRGSS